MKLKDIAKICRSKNAGAFYLTLDVLFENEKDYNYVKKTGVFNRETIARLYSTPMEKVEIYASDPAYALKATIPRKIVAGGRGDTDCFGAQQHAPLLDLEIPDLS